MSYGRNNVFKKFAIWILILGAIGCVGYYFVLKTIVNTFNNGSYTQKSEIVKKVQENDANNLGKPGDPPLYIIEVEVKQITATLDIGEHIKNNMNTCIRRFPVDKRFYDGVEVGQDLNDIDFKLGSLLFDGDASWLKFTVVSKMVIEFKPLEETDTIKSIITQTDTI